MRITDYPITQTDALGIDLGVRGNADLLDEHHDRLAIVGARASTGYGEYMTNTLIAGLPPGTVIVSGGAYGIDATAHRAAVSLGRPTIVVLPCGLDHVYPRHHEGLFLDVLEAGGALVSPFEDDVTASRHRFLVRNGIIAELSGGMVVVEASERSGSLHAAGQATNLGLPLMAVPGPVTSTMSAGTNMLIRQRRATLVTSGQEVLETVQAHHRI